MHLQKTTPSTLWSIYQMLLKLKNINWYKTHNALHFKSILLEKNSMPFTRFYYFLHKHFNRSKKRN
jgi:hypothetical protein